MLTVLTFSILLFLLVTAFYQNVSRKRLKYKNPLHNPVKIALCIIYCVNLTGFIIAGYLILSYEIEIVMNHWISRFLIVLLILALSSPVVYFSRQIGNSMKFSITKIRALLTIANFYPLIIIYIFYNQ